MPGTCGLLGASGYAGDRNRLSVQRQARVLEGRIYRRKKLQGYLGHLRLREGRGLTQGHTAGSVLTSTGVRGTPPLQCELPWGRGFTRTSVGPLSPP